MDAEVKCECGWKKTYRNFISAIYGMEAHWKYQCSWGKGEEKNMPHYGGKTTDASAPILGAGFWKKNRQIIGSVLRAFKTENGECYTIKLLSPIEVDRNHTYPKIDKKEKLDMVSVGALSGFGMALQAAGIPGAALLPGDKVQITCTGSTPSGKGSDQINFDVQIDRGEKTDAPF